MSKVDISISTLFIFTKKKKDKVLLTSKNIRFAITNNNKANKEIKHIMYCI
jgi:hypothetical protein